MDKKCPHKNKNEICKLSNRHCDSQPISCVYVEIYKKGYNEGYYDGRKNSVLYGD